MVYFPKCLDPAQVETQKIENPEPLMACALFFRYAPLQSANLATEPPQIKSLE